MKRNSTIAAAVAVTGVIVAGSLAGVAMVTATAKTSTPTQTLSVVAPGQPDPQFTAAELPAVNTETATPTAEPAQSQSVNTISEKVAKAAVRSATEGRVTGVTTTQHNGVSAFAVTVSRPDGSVVTGFVDASSAVIYDWVVKKEAPKAVTNTYHDDDHQGIDHDGDNDDD